MNAAASPVDPSQPQGPQPISAAAERARAQLHEEIERVRRGVEEMLAEQGSAADPNLQRELADLREDTRLYVKKRLRKSERKMERQVLRVDQRTDDLAERTKHLEARIDAVEADRVRAEVRIHAETERLLDGLLQEMRAIADLLGQPRR